MTPRRRCWSIILRGLCVTAALLMLSAGPVSAEPSNKNSYDVEMSCPEIGETFTLVIIDPNSVARHIEDSNDMLILASVVGEATIDGVTFPIDFSPSEQRFEQQELTTCYVNDTFVLPKSGLSVTVDLTVRALLTPRRS